VRNSSSLFAYINANGGGRRIFDPEVLPSAARNQRTQDWQLAREISLIPLRAASALQQSREVLFQRSPTLCAVTGRVHTGLTTMTRTSSALQDTVERHHGRVTAAEVLSCLLKYVMQDIRNKRVLESGCGVGNYLSCFSETLLESTLHFSARTSASPSISIPDNFRSSFFAPYNSL
jgi:hypothetical protein